MEKSFLKDMILNGVIGFYWMILKEMPIILNSKALIFLMPLSKLKVPFERFIGRFLSTSFLNESYIKLEHIRFKKALL